MHFPMQRRLVTALLLELRDEVLYVLHAIFRRDEHRVFRFDDDVILQAHRRNQAARRL